MAVAPGPRVVPEVWSRIDARLSAMRSRDRERYRELAAAELAGPTGRRGAVRWGRFVARVAPVQQEDALAWLAGHGLSDSALAGVAGVGACGVDGPDFVVCVP